ncbi:2-hydroxyacid dehydrogenase [Consotaella salsifontis]|uniref:Glyoxylate/hydroxypyruvate reductase A n=1 Tax=Consotaella salsifontis TaxID=1365950 RepID=A0A1T4S0Z8_9HYPH|nr:glyoxylate/hydroxypyruvate reductase A [Consotaella salsifontis]SKA21618.1 glyoxylate/hydroxypyruvate reductase A [Consotaella salsifontis]
MTILLSITGFEPTRWLKALTDHAPQRSILLHPENAHDPSIEYAVVWHQPTGLLAGLPNLKAIFSIGAGVDHVLKDKRLPDVPIVRIVADDLTTRMSEYVVWRVLDHMRRGLAYHAQQDAVHWRPRRRQPKASEVTVGIMGFGELGRDAAGKLAGLGFSIAGWSRSEKHIEGVQHFSGEAGLDAFLSVSDIVVCLLPLTAETRGILNYGLFTRMKKQTPMGGPVLINAGRGRLHVEADIVRALDEKVLFEVSLDVFEHEPLPPASPLWKNTRAFLTPHIAAVSEPEALAPLIIQQINAFERGEPLKHIVNRTTGY